MKTSRDSREQAMLNHCLRPDGGEILPIRRYKYFSPPEWILRAPTRGSGRSRVRWKIWKALVKQRVLDLFMGWCAVCREPDPTVLQLDHIAGDGAEQRRANKETTDAVYRQILDDLPAARKRFRLLCSNCNWKAYKLDRDPAQWPRRAEEMRKMLTPEYYLDFEDDVGDSCPKSPPAEPLNKTKCWSPLHLRDPSQMLRPEERTGLSKPQP